MLSVKEMIFFILILVAIVTSDMITSKVDEMLPKKHRMDKFLMLTLVGIVLTVILALIYYFGKVWRDNFYFSVTPAKRCDGGAYMTQSGPSHEMCKELLDTKSGRAKYNMFNCSGGEYDGRPLNFGELMTLSDDNWENRACDNKLADPPARFGAAQNWQQIPL